MSESANVGSAAGEQRSEKASAGLSRGKRLVLLGILTVLLLSVVGRFALADSTPAENPAVVTGLARGLVDPGASRSGEQVVVGEEGTIESLLPVLTEGSFFALIGFALGYTSRKIVKLALIFVAVFFAGLQVLTYAEVAVVDWGRLVEVVNDMILNLKDNQTITQVLTDRVPTVGGFAGGYFLGFRRG